MFSEQPNNFPVLTTDRLILRAPDFGDIESLVKLLSDKSISETCPTLPYPYNERVAFEWIVNQAAYSSTGNFYEFIMILKSTKEIVGSLTLTLKSENQAEIGFWVGKPYWGMGYCTEASSAVIKFAFEKWNIQSVYAECMPNNKSSSKVLKNLGMVFEEKVKSYIYRIGKELELDRYVIYKNSDSAQPEEIDSNSRVHQKS
jgi:ribosomal-protein-alanine N-acetyltransferase